MLEIPKKSSTLQRLLWPTIIALGVLIALFFMLRAWQALTGGAPQSVATAQVEMGDVVAAVAGRGILLPRQSYSVMAEVDGVIQQLELYPGTRVQSSDIILTMRNPLLERERERAELAVLEATAALQSGQARLDRESISLENEIALLEADIRFAKQELETLQTLLEQQILARLDYLRAQINLEKSQLRFELARRNMEAYEQSRRADARAYEYRLEEAQKHLAMIEQDIRYLQVRAESEGILNELSEQIEVGKPIRRGDIIAQITNPESLYADVLIAASAANRVVPGHKVEVQIRQQQVIGEVIRVHPSIQHGQVRVEVLLPEQLPAEARANLDVQARIITAESQQTMRVNTPLGLTDQSYSGHVFVEQNNGFLRREVQFGVMGSDFTEILEGLRVGERILLDVPSRLRHQDFIEWKELTRD